MIFRRVALLVLVFFCSQQLWAATAMAPGFSGGGGQASEVSVLFQGADHPGLASHHGHHEAADGSAGESCCAADCQCAVSHCLSAYALQQVRLSLFAPSRESEEQYLSFVYPAPVFPLLRPPIAI